MGERPLVAESIGNKEEIRSLVHISDAYEDKEGEILNMLVDSGALLKGHFELESGQHTDVLLRFSNIAGKRRYVDSIADNLIANLKADRVNFDAILMQEAAGRVLGGMIADKLGKRKVIDETDERNRPTMTLVNEASLYPGDRVLIVSDIATSGEGLRTMADVVRKKKATLVAIALFAIRDRKTKSDLEHEHGVKIYAMLNLPFEDRTKPAEECELCPEYQCLGSWET